MAKSKHKPFYFDYKRDAAVPYRMIQLLIDHDLSAFDQGLFVAIRFLSRKNGYCSASNKRLASGMTKSVRHIQRALATLVAFDFIRSETTPEGRRRLYPGDHQRESAPHDRTCHLNGHTDDTVCHPPMTEPVIHKYSEDTYVSSSSKKEIKGEKPPSPKIFQKVPKSGLVELNGESSPTKTKKQLPPIDEEAKQRAKRLRHIINDVIPGWVAAKSSIRTWSNLLLKLSKKKGWRDVDYTMDLLEKYAGTAEYRAINGPSVSDAEFFCDKYTWINDKLMAVRDQIG